MKKMMMFMAVAVCSVGVQAASISWVNLAASSIYGLDGLTKLTSAASITANFTATLMDAGTGLAIVDILATTASINTKSAGLLTGATDSYTLPTQYNTGAQFYIKLTAKFGATDYAMLVFKNNTANNFWATAATLNTSSDTFGWTAGIYGGTGLTGDVGKWVAVVPEPTSMALLALGAAALGLRRKFRK